MAILTEISLLGGISSIAVSPESELVYCEHLKDLVKCPVQRGVHISEHNNKVCLKQRCPYSIKKVFLGHSKVSLNYTEVSTFQVCPLIRFPL